MSSTFITATSTAGFIGQISHLGDMVPVMAGVALSFKMRKQPRVGLVYVGDGAMSTGAFHEGINFAAVQRLPLVIICENNGYSFSTPTRKQTAVTQLVDKAAAYGIPGERADGNDVLGVYGVTKPAVERARQGGGCTLIELVTYRRKGHAEHDNQSYQPKAEIARVGSEGSRSTGASATTRRPGGRRPPSWRRSMPASTRCSTRRWETVRTSRCPRR